MKALKRREEPATGNYFRRNFHFFSSILDYFLVNELAQLTQFHDF